MIMDVLSRDKGCLTVMDNATQNFTYLGCHDSRYNLVYDSATRYWPVVFNHVSWCRLWDEGNKSTIDGLIQFLPFKEFLKSTNDIMLDNVPRTFEKLNTITINARSKDVLYTFDTREDFFLSDKGYHTFSLILS